MSIASWYPWAALVDPSSCIVLWVFQLSHAHGVGRCGSCMQRKIIVYQTSKHCNLETFTWHKAIWTQSLLLILDVTLHERC